MHWVPISHGRGYTRIVQALQELQLQDSDPVDAHSEPAPKAGSDSSTKRRGLRQSVQAEDLK